MQFRSIFARLAILFGAFSAASVSAHADVSLAGIGMGHGAGNPVVFKQFQAAVQQYNASGERFHIDTNCPSACTMFLSLRNVCIDPGATLSFHSGGIMRGGTPNPRVTAIVASHYKPALRQFLMQNHFMDTFEFHSISGEEMIKRFGYSACR